MFLRSIISMNNKKILNEIRKRHLPGIFNFLDKNFHDFLLYLAIFAKFLSKTCWDTR